MARDRADSRRAASGSKDNFGPVGAPQREPLPASTRRPRELLLPATLALAVACVLLLGESLLPGRLFLPLTPDDFPEWQAGRAPAALQHHPHPNWCMSDVLHLLVPGLAVTAGAIARGELPLWDDSQALGVPHLHEVHYAVLYPPAWLPLLLGFRGLFWLALLHALAAAIGTLAYLNAIGRSHTAAVAGAFAFAFSAWIAARLHSFPVVGAAVWLPWVLWGLERGSQRGGVRYRLAAAAALALSFLAGFPQIALWVAAVAALLELARAVASRRRRRPVLVPLLAGLASLALGVALALPQLLPTLDYMRSDSLRDPRTAKAVAAEALPAPMLWHLLVPDRYASARLTGPHPLALGAMPAAAANPVALNRAETSMGIGALGLLLALLGMVFGRGWRMRTFAAVALGVFAVLLVPALLEALAGIVPLLRFGNPKRLLVISTFALSVLAAGGVDLVRGRRIAVTATGWVLAVVFAALGFASRLLVPSTELPADVERWAQQLAQSLGQPGLTGPGLLALVPEESFRVAAADAASGSVAVIAVAVFALLMFRPRRQRTAEGWTTRARRSPGLLAAALAIELFAAAFPLLRAAPTQAVTNRPDRIGWMRAPPVAGLLRATREPDQDAAVPPRLARLGDDPPWLRPNFAGLFGLADLQCYAPMAPRRLVELLTALDPAIVSTGSALGGFHDRAALEAPLVDLLCVRALPTAEPDWTPAGWSERGRVGALRVLQNDEALPRAIVVPGVEVVADPAARLARLTAPAFAPRSVALLDALPPVSLPQAGRAAAPARGASVTSWQPGRVTVRVQPGEPGLLVLGEAFHDGWRARVTELADPLAEAPATATADAPVIVADHALLAVPLASRYDLVVTLCFQPPLVTTALLIGGVLWAAAALLFVVAPRGKLAVEPVLP